MSNTPNNPLNPTPPDKGPWLYSGTAQPTPAYRPPASPPSAKAGSSALPAPVAVPLVQSNAPAAPAATPASAPAPRKSDDASLAGIIDTIEAIIIALILALTFRAFIIEAFVIPTGSMAPTLLGAHFNVICPKCGYAFARDANLHYQLQTDSAGRKVILNVPDSHAELIHNNNIPCDETDPIICPNCQYPIDVSSLPQSLPAEHVERDPRGGPHDVKLAWANNGDRILVLKYLYSVMEPNRFDVIVFKEPQNAQDNYIKRLIGLPGETIEVINGDVFIGPPGKSGPGDLVIARKPERVQKDVWQLVYDNDYYPTDEGKPRTHFPPYLNLPAEYAVWTNPWHGEGPTDKVWTVDGPIIGYTAAAPGRLRYAVRDTLCYNLLGYNDDVHELIEHRPTQSLPPVRVNDFRLETAWTPADSAGCSITLTVGAPRNQVRAVWSADGLLMQRWDWSKGVFETVSARSARECPGPVAGHTYRIALNNVDHAARFFIDGSVAGEFETAWSAKGALSEWDALKDGNEAASFVPEIYVDVGGKCELGHLKISRDLFYTQDGNKAIIGHPLTLGADEFFAMGDNSRKSSDGRAWTTVFPALDDLGTRPGIVPRRYLLGKAIFVYWPAGYRFWESFPVPLAPNTGGMRFIR